MVSGLFTTFMKYLVRATSLSKDMRVCPSSSYERGAPIGFLFLNLGLWEWAP